MEISHKARILIFYIFWKVFLSKKIRIWLWGFAGGEWWWFFLTAGWSRGCWGNSGRDWRFGCLSFVLWRSESEFRLPVLWVGWDLFVCCGRCLWGRFLLFLGWGTSFFLVPLWRVFSLFLFWWFVRLSRLYMSFWKCPLNKTNNWNCLSLFS